MANSVSASLHGHDYQARFFWYHAAALRDGEQPHVVEVSYETDGPKAFDDVVVRYDPARRSSTRSVRISADYLQIKFHVTRNGVFGFADLMDPEFTGAQKYSILQRLQQAKAKAPANSDFFLITTDGIKEDDQLNQLISSVDDELRLDKLFVPGGDRSRMGKVRKAWRDHLGLSTDDDLRGVLEGLHIKARQKSLESMRDEVNIRVRLVGLTPCYDQTAFLYDGAIRSLKAAGRNVFDRSSFETLCREEGWIRADTAEAFVNVVLRTFSDSPGDRFDASPDRTLELADAFNGRFLEPSVDWTIDLAPKIENFLEEIRSTEPRIRLFLNAHVSVAFLAGARLGLKSGVQVELVQRGRGRTSIWRWDDGADGPPPSVTDIPVGSGSDLALVVSLSRDALLDAEDYVKTALPDVGQILHVRSSDPPGPGAIAGGTHVARIADAAAEAVRAARLPVGAVVHLFIAAPNAFTFALGQHAAALGRWAIYEFDFERRVDGLYRPSLRSQ